MAARVHEHTAPRAVSPADRPYSGGASVISWPTMPGCPEHMVRNSTGGLEFPALPPGRLVREDGREDDCLCWSPFYWDQRARPDFVGRVWVANDGRRFVPAFVSGRICVLESPALGIEMKTITKTLNVKVSQNEELNLVIKVNALRATGNCHRVQAEWGNFHYSVSLWKEQPYLTITYSDGQYEGNDNIMLPWGCKVTYELEIEAFCLADHEIS